MSPSSQQPSTCTSRIGYPNWVLKRLKALPQLRDDRLVDCNNSLSTLFKSRNSAPTDLPRHPRNRLLYGSRHCDHPIWRSPIWRSGPAIWLCLMLDACGRSWSGCSMPAHRCQPCIPSSLESALNPRSKAHPQLVCMASSKCGCTSGARTRRDWAAPSACQSGARVQKLSVTCLVSEIHPAAGYDARALIAERVVEV
jgi:hypothetical protein